MAGKVDDVPGGLQETARGMRACGADAVLAETSPSILSPLRYEPTIPSYPRRRARAPPLCTDFYPSSYLPTSFCFFPPRLAAPKALRVCI